MNYEVAASILSELKLRSSIELKHEDSINRLTRQSSLLKKPDYDVSIISMTHEELRTFLSTTIFFPIQISGQSVFQL